MFLQNTRYICALGRQNVKNIHFSPVLNTFYVKDMKGGYKDNRPEPTQIQRIRDGLKQLKIEIALWKQEVKEHFQADPLMVFRPGETDIMWQFNNEKSVSDWIVTADSDNNEGFSTCSFKLTRNCKGLFSGILSTKVPKDGRVKRAGYCTIKSLPATKSFKREAYYEWMSYNMLVMKVRGDGRTYLLNIHSKGYFDILWNDTYSFVLHTRGGPYWQTSRIPFSKFFLSSRGRVQDKQNPLPTNRITAFAITAAERIDGPFTLEIDYIGLEYNPEHTEEFAYEMYQTDQYIVAT